MAFELSEYSLNNLTKVIKINNLEIIAKKRYLSLYHMQINLNY